MTQAWTGHGYDVHDLTPEQMMKTCKLNWEVKKYPGYYRDDKGIEHNFKRCPLIRSDNQVELDNVPPAWIPVQNETAFNFFNGWVSAGDMTMDSAGEFGGGKLVWALAKIKNGTFSLFNGKDVIEPYLLFTNPHQYGWSTSVSFSAMRISCMNSLIMSLSDSAREDKIIRVTHKENFNVEEVMKTLVVAAEKIEKYRNAAEILSNKKAAKEDIVTYFQRIFPALSPTKEVSRAAQISLNSMDTQPGAELGAGTWWQPFNAVTHYIDHTAGKNVDTRLQNAWYGTNRKLKIKAMQIALEMAD